MVNFNTCDELDKYEMISDLTTSTTELTGKIRKFISHEQKKLKTYSQSEFSEQKFCEVRSPKPQLLVFINFTLISQSELKINLDVHPSWVLSLLSSLIDIVVSTSLFR